MEFFDFVDYSEVFCEYCWSLNVIRFGVHFHHIKYRSQGWNDDIDNIAILCYRHHNCCHFIENPYIQKEEILKVHKKFIQKFSLKK